MKKKLLLPAILVLSALGLAVGVYGASAHFLGGDSEMTKSLAQKLGVSEDKVTQAFKEIHQEQAEKIKADLEARLTQAVTDGKITNAQKSAILEKFGQPFVKKFEGKPGDISKDEIKSEMENRKKEFETWAQENGIDPEVLRGLIGFKGKRGFMRHM